MKRISFLNRRLLYSLRIEELVGLILITFTLIFASFSNLYIFKNHLFQSQNFALNIARLLISAIFIYLFYHSIRYRSEHKVFKIFRDFGPFLFVLVIYFNLQDAIFILNPDDIHHTLARLDEKLFGIHPSVWAEQFYRPWLTDWFALSYLNYYVMTLILLGLLYLKNQHGTFRIVMLTVMISYFIGFVAYIFFPASSPYLVISDQYQVDIWKDTSVISWLTYTIVDLAPHRVRDAFPSMHNAIVLLTIIMAWRYHRIFFWVQLPLAFSLPFATVYLRYHFVVDIMGAIPVIAVALYLSPRLELKWQEYRNLKSSSEDGITESRVNP